MLILSFKQNWAYFNTLVYSHTSRYRDYLKYIMIAALIVESMVLFDEFVSVQLIPKTPAITEIPVVTVNKLENIPKVSEFERPLPDKYFLENAGLISYYGTTYGLDEETANMIINYCNYYKVDKFIIFELFRLESNFDQNAVSVTGARGFGQLFPIVQRDLIQRGFDFHNHDINNLSDNIQMAIVYFKILQRDYRLGSVRECLIFYNTGRLKHLRQSGEKYADLILTRSDSVKSKIRST